MVSLDTAARRRKRERDRENQRQKRVREKDSVDELKRKNVSLEQELRFLRDGSDKAVQELLETVKLLRQKNEVLTKKLKGVDEFIKTWSSEDQDRSLERTLCSKESCDNIFRATRHFLSPLPAGSGEEQSVDVEADFDVPHGTMPLITGDQHNQNMQDSSMMMSTELAVGEGLVFPTSQEYSAIVESRRIALAGEPFQTTTGLGFFTLSQTRAGLVELKIPSGRVYQITKQPVWERMPLYLDVLDWNPFGSVIHKMRNSPKLFENCATEPELISLLMGNSTNELANSVFQFTSRMPSRGAERCAINWMCYMLTRWVIKPSEDNYSRIPQIIRPTLKQWFTPHPPVFDYVIWPEIRDNFIAYGMKYCRQEVFDLLCSCCQTCSSPDFMVYRDEVGPRMDPKYLQTIYSAEGWMLSEKFWTEYPELVQGLDPQKFMISE